MFDLKLIEGMKKPLNPKFGSGPCTKRVGYSLEKLKDEYLGRFHRSSHLLEFFNDLNNKFRKILNIPSDYKLMIVPASDTGAIELVMWNFLGCNRVDSIVFDYFGKLWVKDLQEELKIKNLSVFESNNMGEYPDIAKVDFKNNDVLFTHCGTTTGVIFKDEDLIPVNRNGLIISDATSYVVSYKVDFTKIDILTFSWQKCIGGEAQHGMVVLSPLAMERLNNYNPNIPIPKIFAIKRDGKIMDKFINGEPINTPSLLACIDAMDSLDFLEKNGGIDFAIKKVDANFKVVEHFVNKVDFVDFLAVENARAKTAVCLKMVDDKFLQWDIKKQTNFMKVLYEILEKEKIAYDIAPHFASPFGFRIWCGFTVEENDLKNMLELLEIVYLDLIKKF
jgi:phosphoserine aminotransferase